MTALAPCATLTLADLAAVWDFHHGGPSGELRVSDCEVPKFWTFRVWFREKRAAVGTEAAGMAELVLPVAQEGVVLEPVVPVRPSVAEPELAGRQGLLALVRAARAAPGRFPATWQWLREHPSSRLMR